MSSRNDHSVGYDHTLLSSVPDPTRAEKQEGYNVDLLDAPDRPNGARAPAVSNHGAEYLGTAVAIDGLSKAPYGAATAAQKVQPWYRRKWGIIGIALVALILIGAAVGAAVGATHHSHPHSDITANGTVATGANSTASGTAGGSDGTGNTNTSGGVPQGVKTTQGQGSILVSSTASAVAATHAPFGGANPPT